LKIALRIKSANIERHSSELIAVKISTSAQMRSTSLIDPVQFGPWMIGVWHQKSAIQSI
jgi:hypothetical protein